MINPEERKLLNEKLAVEVMGAKLLDGMQPLYSAGEPIFDGHWHIFVSQWNPTEDLNQLEACWKMLTLEQKATYKQLLSDHDVQSVFESPEQHAELILKAKGVS